MPVPECSTSSSPGGLPGICAARPRLPAVLTCIWCSLRFRTAAVLARTGAAMVRGAGALLVMFFSGVVEAKNALMPPPVCAGTSFNFLGMLPCSTIEGSDFFWREISGVKFACSLHIFFDNPPPFFLAGRNFPVFPIFFAGRNFPESNSGGGVGGDAPDDLPTGRTCARACNRMHCGRARRHWWMQWTASEVARQCSGFPGGG